MTEEMIKECLEHHFESNPNDNFIMELNWDSSCDEAYPDVQSVIQIHRFEPLVV
jgi:hypothetical protein